MVLAVAMILHIQYHNPAFFESARQDIYIHFIIKRIQFIAYAVIFCVSIQLSAICLFSRVNRYSLYLLPLNISICAVALGHLLSRLKSPLIPLLKELEKDSSHVDSLFDWGQVQLKISQLQVYYTFEKRIVDQVTDIVHLNLALQARDSTKRKPLLQRIVSRDMHALPFLGHAAHQLLIWKEQHWRNPESFYQLIRQYHITVQKKGLIDQCAGYFSCLEKFTITENSVVRTDQKALQCMISILKKYMNKQPISKNDKETLRRVQAAVRFRLPFLSECAQEFLQAETEKRPIHFKKLKKSYHRLYGSHWRDDCHDVRFAYVWNLHLIHGFVRQLEKTKALEKLSALCEKYPADSLAYHSVQRVLDFFERGS